MSAPTPRGPDGRALPVIKVVGVSASGKSALVAALRAAGYDARPVSQEHAGVPDLWRRFGAPQVLIYLDATLAAQQARRPDVSWSETARADEVRRLAHARGHADLVINSSNLNANAVRDITLAWLRHQRVRRAGAPLPPVNPTGAPSPLGSA